MNDQFLDQACVRSVRSRHTSDDFGRCLDGLISILAPDAILLGGGLSNIDELYSVGNGKVRLTLQTPEPKEARQKTEGL